ncbi:MAG: pyridoxamine 5'-phosphate oxidase family protein [Chloroflexota bacterium]|nr:pyridoxamine 5'-phosphate oxidase family protein [Chloroflexota bacterium]
MPHATSGIEPVRSRPVLPKGYGVPEAEEGMQTWSWAVERLESALNYWFSTTRPDGRPHAMPAWAVWVDHALYFDGSPETRRSRNLAVNPAIAVHLESGDQVVILEGEALKALTRWHFAAAAPHGAE